MIKHSFYLCFYISKFRPFKIVPQPLLHLILNPFIKFKIYGDGGINTVPMLKSQNGHLFLQLLAQSRHIIWFLHLLHWLTFESYVRRFVHTTQFVNLVKASNFYKSYPETNFGFYSFWFVPYGIQTILIYVIRTSLRKFITENFRQA